MSALLLPGLLVFPWPAPHLLVGVAGSCMGLQSMTKACELVSKPGFLLREVNDQRRQRVGSR